jgi:hypothetical protein
LLAADSAPFESGTEVVLGILSGVPTVRVQFCCLVSAAKQLTCLLVMMPFPGAVRDLLRYRQGANAHRRQGTEFAVFFES